MYIVRKQKGNTTAYGGLQNADSVQKIHTQESESQSLLDKETMMNIKSLMDENVFDLLDKTESKVI